MLNHFRTRLMNINYVAPTPPAIDVEYVAPGFTAVVLPATLTNFRSLLYPSATRSDVLSRTASYTRLLEANDLSYVFTIYDPRISYTLAELSDFQNNSPNLSALADTVLGSSATVAMIEYLGLDTKLYDMYLEAPSKMTRLAAVIAAYSLKLS